MRRRFPGHSFVLPAVLLLALGASATAQSPATTTSTVATANDQTLAVLWMQRAAEYRAACLQAYRTGARTLPEALGDPRWTACLEQGSVDFYSALPPAVILDVDETVLDNSAFAARTILDGKAFDSAAWATWVHEQQAGAIPGALAYVHEAQQLGVRVIYVTNRKADGQKDGATSTEESDTRANLKKLGFPIVEQEGEDVVLCAGEIGDKAARRAKVCQSFRVVQLVGDNLGDFAPGTEPRKAAETPRGAAVECAQVEADRARLVEAMAGWWGQRWILIPNPSYGGFETVVRGQFPNLGAALRTQR